MSAFTAQRTRHGAAVPSANTGTTEAALPATSTPGTHPERLKKLFSGLVPAQIDHSKCTHQATSAARRICRQAKIEALKASGGGTLVRVIDGEEYVPLLAVRAEALHISERQNYCDEGLNKTFARLGMPATNRHNDTNYNDFDVTVEIEVANANRFISADAAYDYMRIRSGRIATTVSARRVATRTSVIEEDGVEVSRETKQVGIFTVRFHGTYMFEHGASATSTEEAKTADFKKFVNNLTRMSQNQMKVTATVSQNWGPKDGAEVNDPLLLETYRKLVGVDRYSY